MENKGMKDAGDAPAEGMGKGAAVRGNPDDRYRVTPSMDELCAFMAEFVSLFVACGGQTGRVVRCAQRIGLVFGMGVEMILLSRHAVITVTRLCDDSCCRTKVVPFRSIGLNFSTTFALNRLSWEFFDGWLEAVRADPPGKTPGTPGTIMLMGYCVPEEALRNNPAPGTQDELGRLRARFHEIERRPRIREWLVCLMTGVAGASFCRLFGGDWLAMGIVLVASQAAFAVRRFLIVARHMDIRLGFLGASFTASFLAAFCSWHVPSATPEIAVASSILFLVPGIPLLSAVNDILSGHTLMGISRGVNAAILTLCIAFGLVITLMVTGFNVL